MDIGNARSELGYEPEYMYLDYLADFKREMALNRFADLRGVGDVRELGQKLGSGFPRERGFDVRQGGA